MSPFGSLPNWSTVAWVLVGLLVAWVAYAVWRIAVREYAAANARSSAYAVVLTAVAVAGGMFSIPVGFARIAPSQHMVNVMAAVLLGPWWATLIAFAAGVIRNAAGVGTPLAFPGGMIGALLAGLAWRATRRALARFLRQEDDFDAAPAEAGELTTAEGAAGTGAAARRLSADEVLGILAAGIGEIVGTGIVGAIVSGMLVAPQIMAKQTTATYYVLPFLASTIVGTLIGIAALFALRRAEVVRFDQVR